MIQITAGIILAVVLIRLAPLLGVLFAGGGILYLLWQYPAYWLPLVVVGGGALVYHYVTTPSREERRRQWEAAHPDWKPSPSNYDQD